MYTGSADPAAQVNLVLRTYVPDVGQDGTGGAGLPRLTLHLASGTSLQGSAACRALRAHKTQSTATFPVALWKHLVATSSDPANAPIPYPPRWERFWNVGYSVIGTFIPDQAARLKRYPATDNGAFGANPDTRYLTTGVSLKHGPVYVLTGWMPSVPQTLPGASRMAPYELRYWSVCTGSAPTSGLAHDCVFDQQVALREHRYTIVVSKRGDRPRNANTACGYTLLDFGDGERNPDGNGRNYLDVMYMRFMDPNPSWHHGPREVKRAGTEAGVMGAYFPRGS